VSFGTILGLLGGDFEKRLKKKKKKKKRKGSSNWELVFGVVQ
jgi:hypothetical protein